MAGCAGCMYLIGKEAICSMTYTCAGSARVELDKVKPAKKNKMRNEKKSE